MPAELDGLRRDQAAGALLQRRMLPASPVLHNKVRIDYQLWPASGMTGDFVDVVVPSSSEIVFVIADMAGHGAPAALVTVLIKSFMCRLADAALTGHDPAQLLAALNTELLALGLERHVCALCGVVSADNALTLAGGGMLPGPLLHHSGEQTAEVIELPGKALGLFAETGCESTSCSWDAGDRLTVVTDGVLEFMPDTELQAKEAQLVIAAAQASEAAFWDALSISPKAGGPDDLTWFCLERVA